MATSVVQDPYNGSIPLTDQFIIHMAQFADQIPAWGTQVVTRDKLLRSFFPSEPVLCSALFSTTSRYAAFGWSLEGYPRTAQRIQTMLHNSEHGEGWIPFAQKQLLDLFSQDNGAHMEFVRADSRPGSPVVQINHLDSGRCFRTGIREEPIVYTDIRGKQHVMKDYQVASSTEFPSAIEEMRGYQYCVLTRLLKAAQRIRDTETFISEKIHGRNPGAIHLVSGVSTKQVKEALGIQQEDADARMMARYVTPLIIGSIDPTANVSAATLQFANLPDGFDEEIANRWYINQLALAFGADYQDFAPLPGGNLGSAHQAEVLHLKSRGKGPALFMRMYEHKFNFHGVMPNTVQFSFGEQDVALDTELEALRMARAKRLRELVDSFILTPQVARQILMDYGDLKQEYLALFQETNATPTVIVSSSSKAIESTNNASNSSVSTTGNGMVIKSVLRDELGRVCSVVEELPDGRMVSKSVVRDATGRISGIIEEGFN